MKVFNTIEEMENVLPSVLALGNFDGIHLGHREILLRTVSSARAAGLKSGVFTFANHPRNVLMKENPVKNILYPEEKAEIIRDLGIDYFFSLPFDGSVRTMPPETFIEDLLVKKMRMREAYCGFNYRFGYRAEGTPETLMAQGRRHNFGIHVLEPFEIDGVLVSSSLIREKIAAGQMAECRKFLGRYYSLGGEVVVGNRNGKKFGFPTSNILVDETMVTPPNGVYITNCIWSGAAYPSITNVGVRPTIGEYAKNVETHIFQFDKELYGKLIRVEFLERMRSEIRFESIDALIEQIRKDCITARAYHRSRGAALT